MAADGWGVMPALAVPGLPSPVHPVGPLQRGQLYFPCPLLSFSALLRRWVYFCSSKLRVHALQLYQNTNSCLVYNPWEASGLLLRKQLCFLSFSL